uniref:transcription initiation factor TFIID subunit 4-like n=1 Tax=Callithrix jacchus TaxID=9483 RepID=UPI00159F6CC8|nr:transcription initiation factor TFIID subunit 4-like [Callithrix jacchus]
MSFMGKENSEKQLIWGVSGIQGPHPGDGECPRSLEKSGQKTYPEKSSVIREGDLSRRPPHTVLPYPPLQASPSQGSRHPKWPQTDTGVPLAPQPRKAQAGPAHRFRRGLPLLPAFSVPPEPGTESSCFRPRVSDLLSRSLLPQNPRAAPSLRPTGPGLLNRGGRPGRHPLLSLRPSTTCLGLRDPPPPPALHTPPGSTGDAGVLGLFALSRAPDLTTSPSFSHHVQTSGPLRTQRSPALPSEIRVGGLSAGRLVGTRDRTLFVPRPLAVLAGRCAQPGPSCPALPDSQ